MNITFTGPQCSGKTTLLKKMKSSGGIFDKFFYIDEVTRRVRDECNIKINEEGANDITQLLIINEELKNLFNCGSMGDWCKGAYRDWETDRKSTRLNSSHSAKSRMPSSA